MTDLTKSQRALLERIHAADDDFEVAPRARPNAGMLAEVGLLAGEGSIYRITDAGRRAIGIEPTTPEQAAADARAPNPPRAGTKAAMVVELLGRPEGATVSRMSEATGWLPHSVRGFMAGALKKTHRLALVSEPADGGRVYRLAGAAR